ncbi:hypothetical protein B5S32_g3975 [[Candida] boidinii]|nr:hypothetical protein B5S32_g3975 [[Candida] boidinii]
MSTEVKGSSWRLVEVGRIVLVNNKLATIVEIIDQKRVSTTTLDTNTIKIQEDRYIKKTDTVLVDGPAIQRQSIALGRVVLTPLVLALPRGARTGIVHKKWAAAGIDAKWSQTAWAKKIAQRETRSKLSDFERFQVMVLKKQRNYAVKKAIAKA